MIASLRGTVLALESSAAVIEANGVGYSVNVTPKTAQSLRLGVEASLFTAMIVREDDMSLFGFTTNEEKRLFDLLRSVSGVGPKSSLAVLGQLSIEEISAAVVSENDSVFRQVSGIGPKTAKLITVTLAGKLQSTGVASSSSSNVSESVVTALTGLGWPEKTASDAVSEASRSESAGVSADVLLRAALSLLTRAAKS